MGYIKLEQRSDWGNLYLALPGKGLGPHGTASYELGLKFKDGQRLRVAWPDGSQSEEGAKQQRAATAELVRTANAKRAGLVVVGCKHEIHRKGIKVCGRPVADVEVGLCPWHAMKASMRIERSAGQHKAAGQ